MTRTIPQMKKAPSRVPFSFGIVGQFRSQTVWQYHKREGACVGEP